MPRRLHNIEQPITQEMRDEIVRLRAEIARANQRLIRATR